MFIGDIMGILNAINDRRNTTKKYVVWSGQKVSYGQKHKAQIACKKARNRGRKARVYSTKLGWTCSVK